MRARAGRADANFRGHGGGREADGSGAGQPGRGGEPRGCCGQSRGGGKSGGLAGGEACRESRGQPRDGRGESVAGGATDTWARAKARRGRHVRLRSAGNGRITSSIEEG